jgi:cell cycle arrest protein BUB3
MQSPMGFELDSPPSDGVSSLRFAGHADLLLVASWDSHVRLYDATLNTLRVAFKQRAPVLDAAFLVRRCAPCALACDDSSR